MFEIPALPEHTSREDVHRLITQFVPEPVLTKISATVNKEMKKPAKETNAHFALHNQAFQKACEKASIPPTKRQASKFRRKQGLAYQALRQEV